MRLAMSLVMPTTLLKALAVVYGIAPMIILKDICGATDP